MKRPKLNEEEQATWNKIIDTSTSKGDMYRHSIRQRLLNDANGIDSIEELNAAQQLLKEYRRIHLHPERILLNEHNRAKKNDVTNLLKDSALVMKQFPEWHEGYIAHATILHALSEETSRALQTLETPAAHPLIENTKARILADDGKMQAAATLLDDALKHFREDPKSIHLLATRHRLALILGDSEKVMASNNLSPKLPLRVADEAAWAEVLIQETRIGRWRWASYQWPSLRTKLFTKALTVNYTMAQSMLHEALALDPYNPQSLYAAAISAIEIGANELALEFFTTCIDNGDRSMAICFLADPAFAELQPKIKEILDSYRSVCHSVSVHGMDIPAKELILLRLNPKWANEAQLIYHSLPGDPAIVRFYEGNSYFESLAADEPYFAFGLWSDRLYFRYYDAHRALRELSPFLCDTRFIVSDWNTSPYLDECVIQDGRLRIKRHPLGYDSELELDYLREFLLEGRPDESEKSIKRIYEEELELWYGEDSSDEIPI